MTFHGLFIGVDRYLHQDVPWLSCAKRDALALRALFGDTFGTLPTLLTDEAADLAAIRTALEALTFCSPDDFVVIGFSGHGSDTHELVAYDTDPYTTERTGLPLDELLDWFQRIPAKHLVCVLDCCFSGGMGAKVLRTDRIRARALIPPTSPLDSLTGEGRLVLAAAASHQPAWETPVFGHGLLTHFLVQALQGAEEVRQGDRVSVLRLLEFVTERVTNEASDFGEEQHPALLGRFDGSVFWPVFTPGRLYAEAFPERAAVPVTSDLKTLTAHGFPTTLIDAWTASIPSLNELQVAAINDFGILRGENLVVSAPTSSGKTMIGEVAALSAALERKRSFFLLPLKALVADKLRHFARTYGDFGIRTIQVTGESGVDDVSALLSGRYDVCLMTYEKFAMLAIAYPHILRQVGTVVVDEVQMIADPTRGVNLEFLLTYLKMQRQVGIAPQLIALSAVIGETNGMELWLGARLLRREERPVPLDEGILRGDGSVRSVATDTKAEGIVAGFVRRVFRGKVKADGTLPSQDFIIPLVQRLVSEGKQVLVFRETRGEARGCAKYLKESLGLPAANEALDRLPQGDPSVASGDLRVVLEGGVAFHVSDLDKEERAAVEEVFRLPDSPIRVIVATTTLAMGVNTPAEAVVVAGLDHPGDGGGTPYTVAEYKNIIGRAGRLGFATRGASFLLALTPREEADVWRRYVAAHPEDVRSHFLARDTDPRSLVLRVLCSLRRPNPASPERIGLTEDQIAGFLEMSFGAFQTRRSTPGWQWERGSVSHALSDLALHGLVERNGSERYVPTELGRLAGEGGVEVASILCLVDCFRSVTPECLTDATVIAAIQGTVELDQLLFPANKKSTQKEPAYWPEVLVQYRTAPSALAVLRRPSMDTFAPTLRAKKAVACLWWASGMPLEQMERQLGQFGGAFNGVAGPLRQVAARTHDVLPVALRVFELLHPGTDLGDKRSRLTARVEHGVPASIAELAGIVGARLSRRDYLALVEAELAGLADVAAADDFRLSSVLGGDMEKVDVVRRGIARRQRETDVLQPMDVPAYLES